MQQNGNQSMAEGGREASRQRRKYMAEGKQALPTKAERTRTTRRETDAVRSTVAPVPASAPAPSVAQPAQPVAASPAPVAPSAPAPKMPAGGRDASRARRQALVEGKKGLGKLSGAAPSAPTASATAAPAAMPVSTGSSLSGGRKMAQAVRAARAQNGRGNSDLSKPTGRVRNTEALKYPPKVELTKTYGAQSVTGVRIGSGRNVTGTEPGIDKPISGTQYIAADGMGAYRPQAMKVGASKTENGRIVTGTQVRSKVTITGDEFRNSVTITGKADQTLEDDVIERGDAGYPATAQFRRQNNPHGSSVFGANLGRSIKHYGSRERGAEDPASETSLGGHRISGSAIGRSSIVTGDEPGACRPITGSQYLRAAADQPLCETQRAPTPALTRMGMMPARGETETWARQRITGVEVEFKPGTTGDEAGTCAPITGTPYSGPAQYETYCETDMVDQAAARMGAGGRGRPQITGNLPLNAEGVTGTQRGAGNDITGTPYYRQGAQAAATAPDPGAVAGKFSVKSPQREAQLSSGGANHITGSFAVGSGKITGNSEFDYVSRWQDRGAAAAPSITGEGRMEGPQITGSAWGAHGKVTGTEGFTSAGRNPTERTGKPQAFAGASVFKGQGKTKSPTHDVTGMAGTDPVGGGDRRSARVTLSGGARG